MTVLRRLFSHFEDYHEHSGLLLRYMSVLGLIMYPLLYSLRFLRPAAGYDDLPIRVLCMVLLVGALLRGSWPKSAQRFYLPYTYAVMIVCLPLTFVFTSLKNGGGASAVANTFMAVFFLLLLADWRNMVVMLVVGFAAAVVLYIGIDPNPRMPIDYVQRLPLLIGTVIGASLFKHALEQATAERVRHAYASLAGSIAHEMRNPLGRIRHSLESMQSQLPQPTTTAQSQVLEAARVDALYRHLAETEMAVQRGLQVVAMTLDEVSAKPIDRARLSLLQAAEATRKALQEYAFQSDEEAARVELRVTEDFVFRGEETAYVFVIFNLLKNALYYLSAYPNARVTITVDRHQVRVHDNGPGIAAEAQARLFQPFASIGKAGGTGLGLPYCKRVMEAFGGSIRCESVPGEYTEFLLSFPAVAEEEVALLQDRLFRAARAAFAGKRLLLVDDDAAQRVSTRHKLGVLDCEIDVAADGQQALQALGRRSYDLVLLDLHMPVMDGYALARAVRQGRVPVNREAAIVAHTSEPAHVATIKARSAGMDAFVAKAATQILLVQALQDALSDRAAAVERALAGRRVLVADDAVHNRKAVSAYLQKAGVQVEQVPDGAAALERLGGAGPWDAVLLDIQMPGMDGLATASAIRRLPGPGAVVPIIALTAHADDHTLDAAAAAGMNAFLTKPVDAAVLCRTLAGLLGVGGQAAPDLRATAGSLEPADGNATLDPARLESFRRIDMLDELLDDYVPELSVLVERLQRHADGLDLQACSGVLHSLLGMSGELGAPALYHAVRRAYVPMVEAGSWPADAQWAGRIAAIAAETQQALRAFRAIPLHAEPKS